MWHKSDKSTNYSSVSKRQLSVYNRMLSVLKGVSEDRISTAIIYLALKGGINTGRFVARGGRFSPVENSIQYV